MDIVRSCRRGTQRQGALSPRRHHLGVGRRRRGRRQAVHRAAQRGRLLASGRRVGPALIIGGVFVLRRERLLVAHDLARRAHRSLFQNNTILAATRWGYQHRVALRMAADARITRRRPADLRGRRHLTQTLTQTHLAARVGQRIGFGVKLGLRQPTDNRLSGQPLPRGQPRRRAGARAGAVSAHPPVGGARRSLAHPTVPSRVMP